MNENSRLIATLRSDDRGIVTDVSEQLNFFIFLVKQANF